MKKSTLIGISLVSTVAIAVATIVVLQLIVPKQNTDPAQQAAQQSAEQKEAAEKHVKNAAGSEAEGETASALEEYRNALKAYQDAGDKAGEESVKLQIQYLESIE